MEKENTDTHKHKPSKTVFVLKKVHLSEPVWNVSQWGQGKLLFQLSDSHKYQDIFAHLSFINHKPFFLQYKYPSYWKLWYLTGICGLLCNPSLFKHLF